MKVNAQIDQNPSCPTTRPLQSRNLRPRVECTQQRFLHQLTSDLPVADQCDGKRQQTRMLATKEHLEVFECDFVRKVPRSAADLHIMYTNQQRLWLTPRSYDLAQRT